MKKRLEIIEEIALGSQTSGRDTPDMDEAWGRMWKAVGRRDREAEDEPLWTVRELNFGSGGGAFRSVRSSPTYMSVPPDGRLSAAMLTRDAALLIRRPQDCEGTARRPLGQEPFGPRA